MFKVPGDVPPARVYFFGLIIFIYYFIFNSFKEGCPSTSWFSRGPPIKTLVTI